MIYFIQCTLTKRVKIGTSQWPPMRVAEIASCSPAPLTLLAYGDGNRAEEAHYHSVLAEHRVHGEWFEPHQEVIDAAEAVRSGNGFVEDNLTARFWRWLSDNPGAKRKDMPAEFEPVFGKGKDK